MTEATNGPTLLVILDGFGHRPEREDNAIANANTPHWDALWRDAPHTLISGSGLDVGLPEGQMGNSEVGHMSLGSGRIIYQSITRIDKAIAEGQFGTNPAYCSAIDCAVAEGKAVHIMGLLSPGGVHSHEQHMFAALQLAADRGASELFLHAFFDGRDTPPRSAAESLVATQKVLDRLGIGRIASVQGRYWAMDRDKRWDRIEKAFRLLCFGESEHRTPSALDALRMAYERDENDEFVAPTTIGSPAPLKDGDALLFMNFRADRARQLTEALTAPTFQHFERGRYPNLEFVCTTQYSGDFDLAVAFPPALIEDSLGEVIARQGLTQLRIAETEKYAHVTFFFSGGREACFEGETRLMVPSPDVATYELKPEMSAYEITDQIVEAITKNSHDLIVVNYANGDMVGHTGDYSAAVAAVEALDHCIGRLVTAIEIHGGEVLITADHGNCEQMNDYDSGQVHTQHTTNPVPLVYVGHRNVSLRDTGGVLSDVAPTLLAMMGIEQPASMSGTNLITSPE
jgi:2,3-bisphosphoglycerate-independent phosphoglycerate mutase